MPQYKLDPEIKQPAYLQLYHQLRDDITGGICPYGTRLPSKRFLAAETGTSVITVQHAYDLLADEGYIESRERSGFFVSYREHELFPVASAAEETALAGEASAANTALAGEASAANAAANAAAGRIGTLEMPEIHEISDIPLRGPVVSPEEEQFPFSVLARTARRVLSERGESLLQRSPNSGTIELREAIAQYLARSRRINVLPEQIVIGSGSEYLYNLIVQMLGRDRVFALEDPSYEKIRLVYEASGVQCRMIPMDREGVRLGALGRTEASVLHVTPFNSYPSGITATASRRAGYIRWAAGKDRFIIEDDFDSEFSMSTKAEDTLFSLEPLKSVIYMNTFTRTISPAVRVGYMVLPAELSTAMQEKISFYSCTVPVFTQHMLAELIRSGDFERHINRVRRRRRQAPAR
ncbi:MAG: PLP-dependent aminotransferase family protein [Lachnospiraceae bacterium]|nr:PLP-dependent aminotransferase family protein [Lachnospiraceae bacterium]